MWVLMRYCPQGDVIVGSSGAGKEGYGRYARMADTALLAYVPIANEWALAVKCSAKKLSHPTLTASLANTGCHMCSKSSYLPFCGSDLGCPDCPRLSRHVPCQFPCQHLTVYLTVATRWQCHCTDTRSINFNSIDWLYMTACCSRSCGRC